MIVQKSQINRIKVAFNLNLILNHALLALAQTTEAINLEINFWKVKLNGSKRKKPS